MFPSGLMYVLYRYMGPLGMVGKRRRRSGIDLNMEVSRARLPSVLLRQIQDRKRRCALGLQILLGFPYIVTPSSSPRAGWEVYVLSRLSASALL